MASRVEQMVSRSLWTILAELSDGEYFDTSEELRKVFLGLERIVPDVLREIYPEWYPESLDGIMPLLARKIGESEAEIYGLCILMSDQTLTPLHVRLQVAEGHDQLSWIECRLGERGRQGMSRTPLPSVDSLAKLLHHLQNRSDQIEWVYKATFGQRRQGESKL
jgi:hypothetical protein